MKYKNATSPRWSGPEAIDMIVDFEGIGPVPFTATPGDCEAHGRELYVRAVAGDFGPIAAAEEQS
jgi:hypothetical protein